MSPGWGVARIVALKLLRLFGVLFVVAVLCFFSLNLLPGNPARAILGVAGSSPQAVKALDIKLGLDHPVFHRFTTWLWDVLRGNLGTSYQSGVPVGQIITQRAPVTLELILLSQILALLAAVPTAIIAAARRGTTTDRGISVIVFAVLSTPNFVAGFVLIWIFAILLGILPANGYTALSGGLWANLETMLLPSVCLAAAPFALYQRVLRADLVETYGSEFMAVARAKGVSPARAAFRHALRPSLLGLTTSVGAMMGTLLGATIIVETLFALPGLGAELANAVNNRDYVEVQGIVLVMATFFVVVNTIVDLTYTLIDPRLRSVRTRMVGSGA
jgi:peptide/nickel transport system permease protein